MTNLDSQKLELEKRRDKYYQDEIEIKGRLKNCDDKDYYLNEQFEIFERDKANIEEEKTQFNNNNQDLLTATKRCNEKIKLNDQKQYEINKKKENINELRNKIENEKLLLNIQLMKINEQKKLMNEIIKNLENIKNQYYALPLFNDNKNLEFIPMKNDMNSTNNFKTNGMSSGRFTQSNFNYDLSSTGFNQMNNTNKQSMTQTFKSKNTNLNYKPFNADEYFNNLKNMQIINGARVSNDSFLLKEKEYLKQSNESFMKKTKNEYQNMKNDYLKGLSTSSNNNMMLKKEEEVNIDPSMILKK